MTRYTIMMHPRTGAPALPMFYGDTREDAEQFLAKLQTDNPAIEYVIVEETADTGATGDQPPMFERPTLAEEITSTLNRYSAENASNTPDFILAGYLMGCLRSFNEAVAAREKWYGRGSPGCPDPVMHGPDPFIMHGG